MAYHDPGASHFEDQYRSRVLGNPSVVYVLMNNGIYGLTKGQRSPTATQLDRTTEKTLDGISLGLSIPGSTFLARGYSGASDQLNSIMESAFMHVKLGRGFAFVEVMSPCVTYNDTYAEWSAKVSDVTARDGYDRTNRIEAFTRVFQCAADNRIPTGIIFENTNGPTFDGAWRRNGSEAPALIDTSVALHKDNYSKIMDNYAF